MESKQLANPRKNGAVSTRHAVMQPDEETGWVFPTMKPLDKKESAERTAAPAAAVSEAPRMGADDGAD